MGSMIYGSNHICFVKTHVAVSSSYCERMITKRSWDALSFGWKVGHHGYVDLSSLSLSPL